MEERETLDAVAAFLKSKGWSVVVIGGMRVQKPVDGREFHYEFVVRFTGGPPNDGGAGAKPESDLKK